MSGERLLEVGVDRSDLRSPVAFADDLAIGIPGDTSGDLERVARSDGLRVVEALLELAFVVDVLGLWPLCSPVVETAGSADSRFAVGAASRLSPFYLLRTNAAITREATSPVTIVPIAPKRAWRKGVCVAAIASTCARTSSGLFPACSSIEV